MIKQLLVLFVIFSTLSSASTTTVTHNDISVSSSRALMSTKVEGWRNFFQGDSSCVSVITNGAICGWTAVSAGLKCAWSYIKCIIPKCSKCCGKGIWRWACVPCRCSWDCSSKKCKEEFRNVGKTCKIATDGCVKAFNHLGSATKKFFENVGNGIRTIANKIRHAAEWVAQKAWGAIRWVWDQIKKFLDLIKFFEIVKAIGQAFRCFGKLGSSSTASRNAASVRNIADRQGKNGVISQIDRYIPGFKAFVCCMQSTAIGRVLNKWGQSLRNFRRGWSGLKVGSFLDDPAIVVSLAASVAAGNAVGTSLDIAISTAFNIGLYWTLCAGWVTDIGAGVSIVVNLFRKFSFIPGQSIAVSFSVGIPETPIGVGAGVVLPIGTNSIDFGAVNVEVGASNGLSPVSIGGFVCDTRKLVEFNLLDLIANVLTANNECPSSVRVPVAQENNNVEIEEIKEEEQEQETVVDRRLMTNNILSAHKEKVIENIDKQIRDEIKSAENEKRRLAAAEQEEQFVQQEETETVTVGTEERRNPFAGVDANSCGPKNIEGQAAFVKHRLGRLSDRVILRRLCSLRCQNHPAGKTEEAWCQWLRAAACERNLLGLGGSGLSGIKTCCDRFQNDTEDLVFHIRKVCAVKRYVTKPSRTQFCRAASQPASKIQNDFRLVNTILDGCAANYSPTLCRLLKRTSSATSFAAVAKRLCSRRTTFTTVNDYAFGGAAVIGLGVAVGLISIGIKKLRSKNDEIYGTYEQVPDF